MRTLLTALFLVLSASANAGVVAFALHSSGSRLDLHDDAGVCQGEAKRAEWVAPDLTSISGCWKPLGENIRVAFLDGDADDVPMTVFQLPKRAAAE